MVKDVFELIYASSKIKFYIWMILKYIFYIGLIYFKNKSSNLKKNYILNYKIKHLSVVRTFFVQ